MVSYNIQPNGGAVGGGGVLTVDDFPEAFNYGISLVTFQGVASGVDLRITNDGTGTKNSAFQLQPAIADTYEAVVNASITFSGASSIGILAAHFAANDVHVVHMLLIDSNDDLIYQVQGRRDNGNYRKPILSPQVVASSVGGTWTGEVTFRFDRSDGIKDRYFCDIPSEGFSASSSANLNDSGVPTRYGIGLFENSASIGDVASGVWTSFIQS